MKFKFISLLLTLMLLCGLVPGIISASAAETEPKPLVDGACTHDNDPKEENLLYASRPDFTGKLIEITPDRVRDTFDYLYEFYTDKHPEAALMVYTGTDDDKEVIKTLAETITAGCKTDKEKADAVSAWLRKNIYYDVNTSAYASDTFYRREGNCLSYANLMQFVLRSLDIPAVVGDGWRGDMKNSTADLLRGEGHAWCFVYIDDEWVLYDPLWIEGGTTDREYMEKWIYFDTVEFVTPVGDDNNMPPKTSEVPLPYYCNGKLFLWSKPFPNGSGALTYFVNNQTYVFVSNQCEPEGSQDGRLYLDGRDKSNMVMGELYSDGWVSYGNYWEGNSMAHAYAFPNGMMPDGYTLDFDGIKWYMSYDSAVPVLAEEDDYWIQDGLITVRPGFSGKLLGLRWQDGVITSPMWELILTIDDEYPDIATMDDDLNITCLKEGYAEFRTTLHRREKNGNLTLMGSGISSIFVSNEKRIPDYSDRHTHEYTANRYPASCTKEGYTEYTCSCGDSYKGDFEDKLPHSMGDWYNYDSKTERSDCEFCDYYETRAKKAPAAPVIKGSNDAATGKPKLTWANVDNAVSYKVYRSTSKNGAYSFMKNVTGTSYINNSAKAGVYYYYKVKAVAANGLSSKESNVVSRTCDLARPVVKAANVASSGKIKLTWNKIDGAVSYNVYRSTSKNGAYSFMKNVTGTSYTNTTAKAGKLYYYKVEAVHKKSAANSAKSAYVSRTCDLARPTITVKLSGGKPKISWAKVDGAVKYKVYRSTSLNGNYSIMKTVTGTSYVNSNAKAGKTYYYKVVAVHTNIAANSDYSTAKYIKSK